MFNSNGSCPLHIVCKYNSVYLVQLLLNYSDHINARDYEGCIPLYISVSYGYNDIVECLLENGADPNISNNFGTTVLSCVCFNEDYGLLNAHINHGADINFLDHNGNSVFDILMEEGELKIAKYLKFILNHKNKLNRLKK